MSTQESNATFLEQIESSVLDSIVGRYLELLLDDYDPRDAHKLVDFTDDGISLFRHEDVLIDDRALAAMLLGRNEWTHFAVGRVEIACSLFSFFTKPVHVTIDHIHTFLTPREPVIATAEEVHEFWHTLMEKLPEGLRFSEVELDDATSYDDAPADEGKPRKRPDFGSLHRVGLAATIHIKEIKLGYALSAALVDMVLDVGQKRRSSGSAPTMEQRYSFTNCCCCVIGCPKSATAEDEADAADAKPLIGPPAAAPAAPLWTRPKITQATTELTADTPAADEPARARSSTDAPAELLGFFDRASDASWVSQRRYAAAMLDCVVTGVHVTNADAAFSGAEPPLKSIGVPAGNGTVSVYKKIAIDSISVRSVNQYGVATPYHTPLTLTIHCTLRFAVVGTYLLGVDWEVHMPDSLAVSVPTGTETLQAILHFAQELVESAFPRPPASAMAKAPVPVHIVRVKPDLKSGALANRADELAAASRMHAANHMLDKGHARVRKGLADLGLATKAGVARFMELFVEMDTDKDGDGKAIEPHEFRELLKRFGASMPEDDFDEIVKRVDSDRNGLIDVMEFLSTYGFEVAGKMESVLRLTPRKAAEEVAPASAVQAGGCVIS
jgi:hypothetical protein